MTEPRRPVPPSTDSLDELLPNLEEPLVPFAQNGAAPLETEAPDPFDPAALRLPADYGAAHGVRKVLQVRARKPAREWFFMVHPDSTLQLDVMTIELRETNEVFLVNPVLLDDLEGCGMLTKQRLFFCASRQQQYFFWPVKLPAKDGRLSPASQSALAAAEIAMHQWVRIAWDPSVQSYTAWYADYHVTPEWPDRPLKDLLRLAFKESYIDTWDHTVLRQLRGEV
jgi:hypothetical protein